MHDDDLPLDATLAQVEALCQLADALGNTTNKDVRQRLLQGMDFVLVKLAPEKASVSGTVLGLK